MSEGGKPAHSLWLVTYSPNSPARGGNKNRKDQEPRADEHEQWWREDEHDGVEQRLGRPISNSVVSRLRDELLGGGTVDDDERGNPDGADDAEARKGPDNGPCLLVGKVSRLNGPAGLIQALNWLEMLRVAVFLGFEMAVGVCPPQEPAHGGGE